MPDDWEIAFGVLAFKFHVQPSELWAMDVDDLSFWLERVKEAGPHASR